MRALIQRAARASVLIDGTEKREISRGLVILFCAVEGDTEELCDKLAEKTAKLRIFSDENGKMNLSAQELGLSALVVSQFTLAADTRKGLRPSFVRAAQPEFAKRCYERYTQQIQKLLPEVKTGEFGADMQVSIQNDGPVTILLDTQEWNR